MKSRINDVGKVLGGIKKVFSYRVMGMNVRRRLYEGVAVPTALYEPETWGMPLTEKILNLMEMRCLRSMCELMCTDQVKTEEVRRRTGVGESWLVKQSRVC